MKIAKTLAATMMASTLLFGATACAGESEKPSSTSKPTAEQTVNVEAQDKKEIMETVNGLFAYVSDADKITKLADVASAIDSKNLESDEEITKQLKEQEPEAFSFFDAHDMQTTANAFSFVAETAMENGLSSLNVDNVAKEPVVFTAPEESVTVAGDTATVDKAKVLVTVGGKEQADAKLDYAEENRVISLVKKDGKWLVEAPAIDLKTGERVR